MMFDIETVSDNSYEIGLTVSKELYDIVDGYIGKKIYVDIRVSNWLYVFMNIYLVGYLNTFMLSDVVYMVIDDKLDKYEYRIGEEFEFVNNIEDIL